MPSTAPSRRLLIPIASALVAILAMAACGGGSKTSKAQAATTTTTGDRRAALAAFRSCMADHSITLPDRGAGGGQGGPSNPQDGPPNSSTGRGQRGFRQAPAGVDQAKYDAAFTACESKLPTFGAGGRGGRGSEADRTAREAYRRCLADRGVQVPTTAAGATGPRPTINRDDPAYAAADQVCRPLLPSTTSSSVPG